jgi:hypothetical protein
MTYEKFLQITLGIKKSNEDIKKLYGLGVDLYEITDKFYVMIHTLLTEVYTEEGIEWLEWFMYESDFGEKDWSKLPSYKTVNGVTTKVNDKGDVRYGAADENGNPICYSFESTWEYLKQYERNNEKQQS